MSYRNHPAWIEARQQLMDGHPSGNPTVTLAFRMKAIHRLYEIEQAAYEQKHRISSLIAGGRQ